MVQIETDMVQRDRELKKLLVELREAHSDKKRKKLREKSNAIAVALCAFATMHQSLQVLTGDLV
jgi:hypothetical protein